jgi:co-chaperonin GroES (HSP10)
LLPALRWTLNVTVDDQRVWKTDESQVVAVCDNENSNLAVLNKFMLFTQRQPPSTSSILIVLEQSDDTPSGKVVAMGPEVDAELKDTIIFYNGNNFFDNFEHQNQKLAFLKESEVLVYASEESVK